MYVYTHFEMYSSRERNGIKYMSSNTDIIIENELMVSLGMIRHGLYYLYNEDGSEDMLFVFLQLSSSGLERLLKLIITCNKKNKTGNFCTISELKNEYNHSLVNALNSIEDNIGLTFQRNKPLDDLLTLFSEFGQQKRYENLNILSGKNDISYKEQFEDYTQSIFRISPEPQNADNEIWQQNLEVIKMLFFLTNNLLILFDKVCPEGKNKALIYRKQFNNITELLQRFEQKRISVFE